MEQSTWWPQNTTSLLSFKYRLKSYLLHTLEQQLSEYTYIVFFIVLVLVYWLYLVTMHQCFLHVHAIFARFLFFLHFFLSVYVYYVFLYGRPATMG